MTSSNVIKQTDGPVPFANRLLEGRALDLDVWSIYNALALPADCVNLGQGYMNFPPPAYVKDAAVEALNTTAGNHYSHPKGRPRLRKAISDFYSEQFTNLEGRKLDPETEILVTSGANMGMYSVWAAFLDPGDEVILFEPYFDQYLASVTFNAGKPVYVPLHPPAGYEPSHGPSAASEWTINIPELRAAITPRTKMIIVTTPHNPVGKVFTRRELEQIADVAKEFNLLVMSDEVYDCLTFDGAEHVRIATLPGMWERTVTVGSAGKSFSATGWRIGWLIGPPTIIAPTLAVTTRTVFCTNSPLQEAAAAGLEGAKKRDYFETQRKEYEERLHVLMKAFDKLGMTYVIPQGSYFLLLDISDVEWPEDFPFPQTIQGRGKDFKFCWFVAQAIGVSAIPVSEFYCNEHRHIGEKYARFAFCKDLATLELAGERLQKLKEYLRPRAGNGPTKTALNVVNGTAL
ncbi:PLP-dependent transferase [Dacryopinax primogenitus]|uniref:PLP-dependent transferase n=1 Tax=Dacryopinax primogenitus (strain DJM 731) TaxID=1858805 RepID=M5G8E4_DACPD|nr:PLP-dependent transferase [Dacryopinax primogenitus]EJU06486.1 PLP-dependent transferase [Dacryopinax primogenitus]